VLARAFAFRRAGGREIAVGHALCENRFGHLPVQREALRLPVFLVPAEPQPAEAGEDGIKRSLRVAPQVGIVHAQNHGSAFVAGKKPIENERARATHMQKPGGRGRKPDPRHWKCQYNSRLSFAKFKVGAVLV
jgi:hypothetical protein